MEALLSHARTNTETHTLHDTIFHINEKEHVVYCASFSEFAPRTVTNLCRRISGLKSVTQPLRATAPTCAHTSVTATADCHWQAHCLPVCHRDNVENLVQKGVTRYRRKILVDTTQYFRKTVNDNDVLYVYCTASFRLSVCQIQEEIATKRFWWNFELAILIIPAVLKGFRQSKFNNFKNSSYRYWVACLRALS